MKIGFFTDTFYPDLNGVSISVNNFANTLRKKGHIVYIFAPKIKGYKDQDENVIRLPSIKILSNTEPNIYFPLLFPNKAFRKMFTRDFDIIHAHGNGFYSLLGYFISKIKKTPFAMTFHTIHTNYVHYIFNGKLITPKMVSKIFKIFAERCQAVIVPSLKMKKELVSYGLKRNIPYIIPNFLDEGKFKSRRKGFLHDLLNLDKDISIILTVSRIGLEKNIDFILRVFKEVAKMDKKAHLVIVGKGPEKENLENLADELGIQERVHFTGLIDYDDMPDVYADADIFVFVSRTETQGVCVLEAAASGVPCVVSTDLAFKDIVEDRENGFLLPLDEKKFKDKIVLLLGNDKLRREMSKKSIEISSNNFSADKITNDLIGVYENL